MNETYPSASAQLLYGQINGRLIYTLTAKRLYDLSLSKKMSKRLWVYTSKLGIDRERDAVKGREGDLQVCEQDVGRAECPMR